MSKQIGSLSRN